MHLQVWNCNTLNQVLEIYEKAKKCLSKGAFNLRKFKSNFKELEKLVYQKYPADETFQRK